jgi:photosystem II stability/assembly factor-like uncharacterized protein
MDVCLSPNGQTSFATPAPVERLYVGTVDGVHVLDRDHNGRWTSKRHGLDNVHVGSLASVDGDKLFAGAHTGGLFSSRAGSARWEPARNGIDDSYSQVYSLAVQSRSSGIVMWAGTEPAGLFRSDDLGETWMLVPTLLNVPDTDKWFFPPPPHIAHVKHVAFHPSAESTLYVSIEQGALLKSTDDGKTWHELAEYSRPDDPVYRDMHRLTIVPSDPKRLFLTGGNGLYTSQDAGLTWKHVLNKNDRLGYPDQFFIDPRDEETLYIAGAATAPPKWRETHDGNPAILRSRDGGATWQELTNGLPEKIRGNIEAMTLAHGPHGLELFAGTATGEVFASHDGGESWSTIVAGLPPVSKGNHHVAFLVA